MDAAGTQASTKFQNLLHKTKPQNASAKSFYMVSKYFQNPTVLHDTTLYEIIALGSSLCSSDLSNHIHFKVNQP